MSEIEENNNKEKLESKKEPTITDTNNIKQLLIDYRTFDITPQTITESLDKNNGKLIVSGILQEADVKNQNGRIYPKNILEQQIKKYDEDFVQKHKAMGELDHPDSLTVNLSNVSHNITEIHWDGNKVIGTIEILSTPSGNILKELFKSGIKLGISSRSYGSLIPAGDDTSMVSDDFLLICFDFVSDPSVKSATFSLNESKNIQQANKYDNINKILTNIFCTNK